MLDNPSPATKRKSKRDTMLDSRPSFDVTCKIGTVYLDDDGTHTPMQAAYRLIADHDAPGEYVFPLPNGDLCRVAVEYEAVDTLHPQYDD